MQKQMSPKQVPQKPFPLLINISLRDSVRHAEIKWVLTVVMKNLSLRSCTDISSLFEVIFPDSKIAKEFTLGKDKCAYTLYYGIAPHVENILIREVQQSDVYSISFHESLNKVTQKGRMDFVITY